MSKTYKNGFSDGLVMDLNPTITRNSVMTSALNATLITNNGNEMTLQQDMGNGRVQGAVLPKGYIPMGSCEFGGIIYIASYNPVTNQSQIGSFPSPERSSGSGSTQENLKTSSINYSNFLAPLDKNRLILYDYYKTSTVDTRTDSGIVFEHSSTKKITYSIGDDSYNTKEVIDENGNSMIVIYPVKNLTTYKDNTYSEDGENDGIALNQYDNYLIPLSTITNEDHEITLYKSPKQLIRTSYKQVLTEDKLYPGDKFMITYQDNNSSTKLFRVEYSESGKTTKRIDTKNVYKYWKDFLDAYVSVVSDDGKLLHLFNESWTPISNIGNSISPVIEESAISTYAVDSWRNKFGETALANLQTFAGKISGKLAVDLEVKTDDFEASVDVFRTDAQQQRYEQVIEIINNPTSEDEKTYSDLVLQNTKNSKWKVSGTWFVQATARINVDFTTNNNCVGYLYIIKRDISKYWNGTKWVDDIYSSLEYGNVTYLYEHGIHFGTGEWKLNSVDRLTTIKIVPYYRISEYDNATWFKYKYSSDEDAFDLAKYYSQLKEEFDYDIAYINPQQEIILNIDPSKAEKNSCELNQFRYYNTDDLCSLTLGLETYVRTGHAVKSVYIDFYDDAGVAGRLVLNRDNYNGIFTESFVFESVNSAITMPLGDDQTLKKHYYQVLLNQDSNKVTPIEDSGIIHKNLLYAANIKVIFEETETGLETIMLNEWRWLWTNKLMNSYYYYNTDYELINPSLQWNSITQFALNDTYDQCETDSELTESKTDVLQACVNHLNADIQGITGLGLQNNYDSFYINPNFGKIPISYYYGDYSLTPGVYEYANSSDSRLIPTSSNNVKIEKITWSKFYDNGTWKGETISESTVDQLYITDNDTSTTETSDSGLNSGTTGSSSGGSSSGGSSAGEATQIDDTEVTDDYPNWDDTAPHNQILQESESEELDIDSLRETMIVLPSGTCWPKYNLGSSKAADVGSSYRFGHLTSSQTGQGEAPTYVWYNLESGDITEIPTEAYYEMTYTNNATRETTTEYSIAGTQYDPATKNLGEGWHMPYRWQLQELFDECEFSVSDVGDYFIVSYTWEDSKGVEHTTQIQLPYNSNMVLESGVNLQYFLGSFDLNTEKAYTLSMTSTTNSTTISTAEGTYYMYLALPIRPVYSKYAEDNDVVTYDKTFKNFVNQTNTSNTDEGEEIEDDTSSSGSSSSDSSSSGSSSSDTTTTESEFYYLNEEYESRKGKLLFTKYWTNNATFLNLFNVQSVLYDKYTYDYKDVQLNSVQYIRPFCMEHPNSSNPYSDWETYGIDYANNKFKAWYVFDPEEGDEVAGYQIRLHVTGGDTTELVYSEGNFTDRTEWMQKSGYIITPFRLGYTHDSNKRDGDPDAVFANTAETIDGKRGYNWPGEFLNNRNIGYINNNTEYGDGLSTDIPSVLTWNGITDSDTHVLNQMFHVGNGEKYMCVVLKSMLNQIYYLSDTELTTELPFKINYNYLNAFTKTIKIDVVTQIKEITKLFGRYYSTNSCPITFHGMDYVSVVKDIYSKAGVTTAKLSSKNIDLNINELRKTYVLPININTQIPDIFDPDDVQFVIQRKDESEKNSYEISTKKFYEGKLYNSNGENITDNKAFEIKLSESLVPKSRLNGLNAVRDCLIRNNSSSSINYLYINLNHFIAKNNKLLINPITTTADKNCKTIANIDYEGNNYVKTHGVIESRYLSILDGNAFGITCETKTRA